MNKYVPLFALCATLLGSTSVLASSSTDVSVTGTITPAACTPSLSGAGGFDFGKVSVQDLDPDKGTTFTSSLQRFTVACSAPTRFALSAVDNREGSSSTAANQRFGLGMNGTEKIGSYLMGLLADGLVADGDAGVQHMITTNGGDTWIKRQASVNYLYNRNVAPVWHGFALQNANEPSPINTLSGDIQVEMTIVKASDLTLTDDINIDGAASLEVHYL